MIIADESHRSLYNRYRQIFEYFDSYQLGLHVCCRASIKQIQAASPSGGSIIPFDDGELPGGGYCLLPANDKLHEKIDYLLIRSVGHPPKKLLMSFACFEYRTASWTKSRRVVVKVEWHRGELYPRVGYNVMNLTW